MEAAPDAQQKRKKNRKNKGRNKLKPKQSEQLQRGGADGAGDSGKQRTQPPPRVAGDGAYKPGLSKKQRQKEKRRQAVEAAAAADDGPSTSGRGAAAAASPGAPLFGGKKEGKAASGGGKGECVLAHPTRCIIFSLHRNAAHASLWPCALQLVQAAAACWSACGSGSRAAASAG